MTWLGNKMKARSTFTDQREVTVEHKVPDPVLDIDLHVDPAESRIYSSIPVLTRRKLLFISSDIALEEGGTGIYCAIFDGGDLQHTLSLYRGEPVVIPVGGSVNNVTVSNTTGAAGKVRLVVL